MKEQDALEKLRKEPEKKYWKLKMGYLPKILI